MNPKIKIVFKVVGMGKAFPPEDIYFDLVSKEYVSPRSKRKLKADPSHDPELNEFLLSAYSYTINAQQNGDVRPRTHIMMDYVLERMSYNENDQNIYKKSFFGLAGNLEARLGEFLKNGVGSTCREFAYATHLALAQVEVQSEFVVGNFPGGMHAWTEVPSQDLVVDSTFAKIYSIHAYYQNMQVIEVLQRETYVKARMHPRSE